MTNILEDFYKEADAAKFSNVLELPQNDQQQEEFATTGQKSNLLEDFYTNNPTTQKEQEGWGKWLLRSLYQIPSGLAQAFTYPLDLLQMAATGSALDHESIDELKRAHEQLGKPFDEEKYRDAALKLHEMMPTQGNLERMIEEQTGFPTQAKTTGQKVLKLGSSAAGFTPGTLTQKATAGVTAPAVSQGLQTAGVPEPVADIAGLGLGTAAGSFGPKAIETVKKPSGLTERQFESTIKPKKVTEKRFGKINEALENDFKQISDDLIKSSPVGKTHAELESNPLFKSEVADKFKEVEKLAETMPTEFDTIVVKKAIAAQAGTKISTKLAPSEYTKEYNKLMSKFIKETPKGKAGAKDLVRTYRNNNKDLAGAFDPGKSRNFNTAKKDALLDYNRAIAKVIEKEFPDTEFAKLFPQTNKEWSQIVDSEKMNEFINSLFQGKVNHNQAKEFFDSKFTSAPFKRALGEEYPKFEQLMKDVLTTERPYKMLKVAKSKGFGELAETAGLYILNPTAGKIKKGFDFAKDGVRRLINMSLDKPKFTLKWHKAIDSLKKGDFKSAEKEFEALDSEVNKVMEKEAEAIKPQGMIEVQLRTAEGAKKPK